MGEPQFRPGTCFLQPHLLHSYVTGHLPFSLRWDRGGFYQWGREIHPFHRHLLNIGTGQDRVRCWGLKDDLDTERRPAGG